MRGTFARDGRGSYARLIDDGDGGTTTTTRVVYGNGNTKRPSKPAPPMSSAGTHGTPHGNPHGNPRRELQTSLTDVGPSDRSSVGMVAMVPFHDWNAVYYTNANEFCTLLNTRAEADFVARPTFCPSTKKVAFYINLAGYHSFLRGQASFGNPKENGNGKEQPKNRSGEGACVSGRDARGVYPAPETYLSNLVLLLSMRIRAVVGDGDGDDDVMIVEQIELRDARKINQNIFVVEANNLCVDDIPYGAEVFTRVGFTAKSNISSTGTASTDIVQDTPMGCSAGALVVGYWCAAYFTGRVAVMAFPRTPSQEPTSDLMGAVKILYPPCLPAAPLYNVFVRLHIVGNEHDGENGGESQKHGRNSRVYSLGYFGGMQCADKQTQRVFRCTTGYDDWIGFVSLDKIHAMIREHSEQEEVCVHEGVLSFYIGPPMANIRTSFIGQSGNFFI